MPGPTNIVKQQLIDNTPFLPKDARPAERKYCIDNNFSTRPVCAHCGKVEVKFQCTGYYSKYCSLRCAKNSPEAAEKYKQTCLDRYGVENVSQASEIKQKKIQSSYEHYGVAHPLQSSIIQQQIVATNLNAYGVRNVSQVQSVKDAKIATTLQHYGVENPYQAEEVKAKTKATLLQKYGVDNPNKSPELQAKIRATNLLKYGVTHPNKSPELHERNQRYRTKHTTIAGHEVSYQGYELVAWQYLLYNGMQFDDIIFRKGEMPTFDFVYNGKNKRYFPDLYLPKDTLIIEVKSTWTMQKYYELNMAKRRCVIDAGYNFEFWICSHKERLEVL